MLHILPVLILFEGVELDAEWYTLLSAMLPRCELCAYAVHLTTSTTDTQLHYETNQLGTLTIRVINIVCVRVVLFLTCTNTDARLETSHRNSAALSWEAWVWGSVIPTHIGISTADMKLCVLINQCISGKDSNQSLSCKDVPMSRRRSPGRFHFQPSSC